jgi:hypothetical protein
MRRDSGMNFQSRSPLTPTELARRAAALSTVNHPQVIRNCKTQPQPDDIEHFSPEPSDERQYGSMAAKVLRDAKRSVALASTDARLAVFGQAAATLAEAVAGYWLPKNVMVDRLTDIAEAHNFFDRDQGDIHGIIGEFAAKVPVPITSVVLPPLSSQRRLISHRASDLKPEKLVWVWPGRIPEGKLVLLGGQQRAPAHRNRDGEKDERAPPHR